MAPKRNVETAADATPAPAVPGARALRSSDRVTRSTVKVVKFYELPDKSQAKKLKEKKVSGEGEVSGVEAEPEDRNNTKHGNQRKSFLKRAIKAREGLDNSGVNVAVKKISHLSQTSTLTLRPQSFKKTFRQPMGYFSNEKLKNPMVMNRRRRIFDPKIIFPYVFETVMHNGDVSDTSLAVMSFPRDPTIRINNPMYTGFPIGNNTHLTSTIRGLVFVIGDQFHRVGNPFGRTLSDVSHQPIILDSEFVDAKYFMGYDALRNRYKIIRFLDRVVEEGGESQGTHIHAFTIGVDQDWREVGLCHLMIVFQNWIPNEGIHTLVNQSSHVHFLCHERQPNGNILMCILSFDLHSEQVTRVFLPPILPGFPVLCGLQHNLCCANRFENTLQIHQLNVNNIWELFIEVNTIPYIPPLSHNMFLPIALERNLLLLAFRGVFHVQDDPGFPFYQHGFLVNIVTGAVQLINSFRPINWFDAKSYVERYELLPY